jgi:hypothetical protein
MSKVAGSVPCQGLRLNYHCNYKGHCVQLKVTCNSGHAAFHAATFDSDPRPARSTPSSTWTAPLKATRRKTACFAKWAGLFCGCNKFGIEGEEVSVFKVILSQRLGQPECKVRAAKINMPISVYCPELDAGVAHDLWTAKARQMSEMCQTTNLMLFLYVPFGIRISSHIHRCFVLACLVLGSRENKH